MILNLSFLILFVFSCHLAHAQRYVSRCPSDQVAASGCPSGWYSYKIDCYLFNMSRATYQDAKDSCNRIGARLVRFSQIEEFTFLIDVLNKVAVNRSIAWYTAAIVDPAALGKYIWDGYPIDMKEFNTDLVKLLLDVPDLNNVNAWNKERSKVSILYTNMKWMLNVTTATDNLYFVCEASKASIDNALIATRGPDFGQSDLTNVLRGPCITLQPQDQLYVSSLSSSKLVTFTCGVYGNPMPRVSWYFIVDKGRGPERILINPLNYTNGQVTQTGGILSINDPDDKFDNKIECHAENEFGAVISREVQIVRGYLEMYKKQTRQKKVISDNMGFLLDCEVPSHSPKDALSFTYYTTRVSSTGLIVDDVIQGPLRNNIFLSHNRGLIGFSVASNKDNGDYKCAVGFKGLTGTSHTSPNIPLEVENSNTPYPVPMINDQFPNFRPSIAFLGDTVEFECFGYGEIKENPLRYDWFWNGKKLPEKAKISDFERRVTLENVQFEDQGEYGCRITSHDKRISEIKSIPFKINAKPTFIIQPTNQYPDVGSTVSINCHAFAKPDVTIRWYRNDIPLATWLAKTPDARYNFTDGSLSQASLTISNVRSSDNAMIGCLISNDYGRDAAFVELKAVSMRPNFFKYPLLNTEAIQSGSVILRCQPEGSPTPSITWTIKGSQKTLPTSFFNQATGNLDCSEPVCVLPNNNLFIKAVSGEDRGEYSCTATNPLGSATSTAYLDVIAPLSINNFPVGRRVQVNTNVYLPCQASGTPNLDIDYDWYFENVQIRFDRMDLDARRYDKSQFLRPYYRYFGTMMINNIQFQDEGNYSCRITTPFNSIEKYALIKVLGPPGVGGGISITQIPGNNTNYVDWTDGNNHGSPVIWYKLEVTKEDGANKWYVLVDRINRTDVKPIQMANEDKALVRNRYMFAGLPANTVFRLRISAVNEFGMGLPSGPSEVFKTQPMPPVKVPQNVTGGGGKIGTLVIRWEPLNPLEENGDNFGYDISYKLSTELQWVLLPRPLNKSLDNNKYLQVTIDLQGKFPYTEFDVRVRAVNEKGNGSWSPISKIMSSVLLPTAAPQDVKAGSYNATAIEVEWKPPAMTPAQGVIKGYHIVYWMRFNDCKLQAAYRDRMRSSQRLTLYGTMTRGIIIGLAADRYYCIGVQAFNSAGDGPESSFFDQTTFKNPPQSFPTVMRLNSTNTPHQIQVTWNGVAVKAEEESVDGYRIRYWEAGAPVRIAKDVDVGLKVTGYINELQYNVRYNLRIFAYSRGGHGKLSNPMDQFMLVPRSMCDKGKVIEGPDVRFVFICSGVRHPISLVLLSLALVAGRLIWW